METRDSAILNGIFEGRKLITLYDLMEKIVIGNLFRIHELISELKRDAINNTFLGSTPREKLTTAKIHIQLLSSYFSNVPYKPQSFSLTRDKIRYAILQVDDILDENGVWATIGISEDTVRTFTEHVLAISFSFERDCQENILVLMENDKSVFYKNSVFEEPLKTILKDFELNLINASKCLSYGLPNASAYYSIGVLERCIREFGKKLGFSQWKSMDWGELVAEIGRKNKAWKPNTEEKEIQNEISTWLSHFWALNKGLRIDIAHSKKEYDHSQAVKIFDTVRSTLENYSSLKKIRIPKSLKTTPPSQ